MPHTQWTSVLIAIGAWFLCRAAGGHPLLVTAAVILTALAVAEMASKCYLYGKQRELQAAVARNAAARAHNVELERQIEDLRACGDRPFPFTGKSFDAVELIIEVPHFDVETLLSQDGRVTVNGDGHGGTYTFRNHNGKPVSVAAVPEGPLVVVMGASEAYEEHSDIVMALSRWADEGSQIALTYRIVDVHGEPYATTELRDSTHRITMSWPVVAPAQ